MKRFLSRLYLIIGLLYCWSSSYAGEIAQSFTNIHNVRIWVSPENTRIVFEASKAPNYTITALNSPHSIIVDFKDARLNSKLIADLCASSARGDIAKIIPMVGKNKVKVKFNLKEDLKFNSFLLKPNERYLYRLVIDLESREKKQILALFDLTATEAAPSNHKNLVKPNLTKDQSCFAKNLDKNYSKITPKFFTIAIDPGHGGEDPGAIGPRGTLEKDVVLAIAQKLTQAINLNNNMRAVLIRNGDYYIGLKERVARARKYNADLFLSIHADAFTRKHVDGASVFVLSEKGASSAAAHWLADSQNKADLIGGIKIDGKKDFLAPVLFDLFQTANYKASLNAAHIILDSLKKEIPLHKVEVEHANFMVLKSPDLPSVLVETGFISNPITELKLRNSYYQKRIAYRIKEGIANYINSQLKS